MSQAVRFEPADAGDASGIARIVLDRPDDAVNAINLDMIDGLSRAVRAIREASPTGVVVSSAKDGQWVAGADLKLVVRAREPAQIDAAARRLQAVLDELAWLPCTTVAAINGAALGGGLELALACDYRVASDAASVTLGQPEVNLGLVPAGGGTQRLPRLLGLERGLDLLLTGRRLNARRALRAGLVDEVVHPSTLEQAARAWAARPKRALDRPLHVGFELRTAIDVAEQTALGRQLVYRQARQTVLERTHGQYPAPLRILEAVETGFERGMAEGLDVEARAFGELATTEAAANLIWLFMATQRGRRRETPPSPLSQLGVVGAGFMGAAIAEVAAAAGVPVRIKDVSPEAAARGLAGAAKIVDAGVSRRRFSAREGQSIQRRLSATADDSGFARADVVIEAVFEDPALKRDILRHLESVVPSRAVLATNTSAIPIHKIASGLAYPERVVGMHFFSPAERMPLLEVVRPAAASEHAVAAAVALGARMGKTSIVVGDAPGFYTSRVLGVMLNEAALLLAEGARLEDVDRALVNFGFPVGPFVLFDEVGLEVAQHVGETVGAAFGDRIPGATIVNDLVERGETGRKAGRGFYVWPAPPPTRVSRLARRLLRRSPRSANPFVYGDVPRRGFPESSLQDRLVLLFVNEAIRCLDEGVLASPTDGDVGAVLGLGFPPFRGGPFHYADAYAVARGAAALAERLRGLAAQHGPRFEPAESLSQARTFFDVEDPS
jgi:3-hydroxyacyl-CoA dehydrogenase/enoyl-CoA hydratase/3-hydroxybutyryl-CoA epimerase